MLGYMCKYTPVELCAAFGLDPRMLDGEEVDFSRAETATHANLCSHAKSVLQQAEGCGGLLLTSCCDSIRRVYDVLAAEGAHRPLDIMDLPHEANGCSINLLAAELHRMVGILAEASGRAFDTCAFLEACRAAHEQAADPSCTTRPFVAVLGARVSPALMHSIEETLSLQAVNLTCSGARNLETPPAEAPTWDFPQLMEWYAGALLRMVPCMRMADVAGRRALTENPQLAGIVYHTVKFCDYYGFDYHELTRTASVPVLKIESDYQPAAPGQLATRLEAFAETLQAAAPVRHRAQAKETAMPHPTARYVAGIDSGSTSTNMVVLDSTGAIAASASVRTGAKAINGATAALAEVAGRLGIAPEDIGEVVATGYGRFNIPFATDTVTEITCHARGAHALHAQARCIVDIGGQDSKVICLNDAGQVANFIMNDKCAAGTGRFLEAMARTLEMDLSRMSEVGRTWKSDLTISSMCTVFAESEVISLIADNHADADIVHGLNKSIASRTASMVTRAKGVAPYMMTGGVARNRGVVEELERKLGAPLFIAEDPDLCGALGAALFAFDRA